MKLGEALIKTGLITKDQLDTALEEQQNTNARIGDILINMGMVTPQQFAPILARYFKVPFVNLREVYKDIKPEVIDNVPFELAHRFTIMPLAVNNKSLVLAMHDPLDLVAVDTLRIRTGHKIRPVVAIETEIKEAIEYCYNNLPRLKEHVESYIELEIHDESDDEKAQEQFAATDQPVVQYVKSLIIEAVNSRASDILIQPKQDEAELRFRIDGSLHPIDPPPKMMLPAISTRIKILAGLDIAERRLPQDGRFRVKIGETEADIRTSTFPTIYGESIVLRILDTSQPLLGLDQLGFEKNDSERFQELLQRPYGLILVTGPTGSGKTTTLYTCLNEIKSEDRNILTLEDPVEYRLPFLQQSQVKPQIGFDFATGLRSMLRQDPDVIMIGEIRDHETAEIAIHAALTGHLVLATLHTNDAASAAVRLTKMGIEPYLITSSLLCVVAQRLIRLVCPHCKQMYNIEQGSWERIPFSSELSQFAKGKGCPKCFNSGYKGRLGIYELLVPNDGVANAILRHRGAEEVSQEAQKAGMKTLRQSGLEKLKAGLTTPEEVIRITQDKGEV